MVGPGRAACAKGDAELDVVRFKPKLLHTQWAGRAQKCKAQRGMAMHGGLCAIAPEQDDLAAASSSAADWRVDTRPSHPRPPLRRGLVPRLWAQAPTLKKRRLLR